MILLFYLSLSGLFVGYSFAQVTCVENGSFLANPNDCKSYFVCRGGEPVFHTCGDVLVWDPANNVCNWPNLVPACGDTGCPATGTDYLADPENCKLFYRCENGQKTEFQCGFDYLFDASSKMCKPPQEVTSCTDGPKPSTPLPPDPGCPPTGNHYFGDPENCKRYYRCEDGQKHHLQCGFDYAFDDSSKTCKPDVANCNNGPKPTTPIPPPTPTIPGYVQCTVTDYHPDLEDCTKYYRCFGGNIYHLSCPRGYIYDLANNRCDDPVNIGQNLASLYCNKVKTTPAPTTTPEPVTICYLASTPPPVCSAEPPTLGQPVTTVAPETICVTVDSPVKRQVEEVDTDFKCKKNGRFRNERQTDDSSYIYCHNNTAKIKPCRFGKVFNPSVRRCVRAALSE